MSARPNKAATRATPARKRPAAEINPAPIDGNGASDEPSAAIAVPPVLPLISAEVFVPVRVADVVMALPAQNPYLVLEEVDPPRRQLAIPIGLADGTAIAYALRGLSTPKPLTHELFATTLTRLGASVAVARIITEDRGAFYAEIVVSGPNGQHEIDCRPTDAVALALRQVPPAPIVCASALLERAAQAGAAGG